MGPGLFSSRRELKDIRQKEGEAMTREKTRNARMSLLSRVGDREFP